MPGPTFQTSGTNLDGASTSTPQFPAPSGVAANDIIVIAFYSDGHTVTVSTPPSGFSAAPSIPLQTTGAPSGQHTQHVYWKRATGGGEPSTYDFTLSGSTFVEGRAHRYNGCRSSGSPWGNVATAIDISGTTALNVGPVSSTMDNSLFIHTSTDWSGGSWTPSSGFTERQDGSVGLIQLSDKAQATAGSSGTVAATCTNSDKQTAWLGVLEPDISASAVNVVAQISPDQLTFLLENASQALMDASQGVQIQTVAEGGISSIGLSGRGGEVRVAKESGIASAGFAGTGGEVRVAKESGIGTVGLTGTSGEVKVAKEGGVSATGFAGRGADSKIAPEGGSSSIGLAGRGTEIKVMPEGGRAAAGLAGRGTEIKRMPEGGSASVGLSGAGSEMKKAVEGGRSAIGLIGFGQSRGNTGSFLFFFMS